MLVCRYRNIPKVSTQYSDDLYCSYDKIMKCIEILGSRNSVCLIASEIMPSECSEIDMSIKLFR